MKSRTLVILTSLGLAFASCVLPFVYRRSPDFQSALYHSFWISALWGLFFGIMLGKFGREARVLLVGLPFSLFWPIVMLGLYTACGFGIDCP
jgi:hypothetical protein